MTAANVTVIDHPLVQHKLTLMRQKERSTNSFRELLGEISMLLAYEVTRDLPLVYQKIETPLATMRAPVLEGKKVVLVNILRAGTGMVDGMLPHPAVGARRSHRPLPRSRDPGRRRVLLQDAERDGRPRRHRRRSDDRHRQQRDRRRRSHQGRQAPKSIKFVCILAAPEGLANFHDTHPDVPIFTAAIDEGLDDHGYILPGLGDAGDRLFGTK